MALYIYVIPYQLTLAKLGESALWGDVLCGSVAFLAKAAAVAAKFEGLDLPVDVGCFGGMFGFNAVRRYFVRNEILNLQSWLIFWIFVSLVTLAITINYQLAIETIQEKIDDGLDWLFPLTRGQSLDEDKDENE